MSVPRTITLRRTLYGRLFGTTAQGILTIVSVSLTGSTLLVLVVTPSFSGYDLAPVPFLLLWSRGLTAWCRADEDGIHTRFWIRWDVPWGDVHSVALQRLARGPLSDSRLGPPAIVVHTRGDDATVLTPAQRCGQRRREFGTALLAFTRARGAKAVVGDSGWTELQDTTLEPYE